MRRVDRRVLVAVAAVAVTALVVALLVVLTDVRRVLPGVAADCTVTKDGRTVDLTQQEAEELTAQKPALPAASLTCLHGGSDEASPDRIDGRGLTVRAEAVRRDMLTAFGRQPLGGFAPGGVRSGHMPGSAHYEGRAIDVFFRPVSARNKARGWVLALYLVAHAKRLAIDTVIFDARIWTARRADEGWRDYRVDTTGRSRQVARILEHRDHVHVDLAP
jgi:hypothetical protein